MKFVQFLVIGACALLFVAQFLLPHTPFSLALLLIAGVGLAIGTTIGFIKTCTMFFRK